MTRLASCLPGVPLGVWGRRYTQLLGAEVPTTQGSNPRSLATVRSHVKKDVDDIRSRYLPDSYTITQYFADEAAEGRVVTSVLEGR